MVFDTVGLAFVPFSQSYLSAIVCALAANDTNLAEQTLSDVLGVDEFRSSGEGLAAELLVNKYIEGDGEEVKRIVAQESCFKFLDNAVGRLVSCFYTDRSMDELLNSPDDWQAHCDLACTDCALSEKVAFEAHHSCGGRKSASASGRGRKRGHYLTLLLSSLLFFGT